jgi:hypothetical protein
VLHPSLASYGAVPTKGPEARLYYAMIGGRELALTRPSLALTVRSRAARWRVRHRSRRVQ